jgi:hypothetical protein
MSNSIVENLYYYEFHLDHKFHYKMIEELSNFQTIEINHDYISTILMIEDQYGLYFKKKERIIISFIQIRNIHIT